MKMSALAEPLTHSISPNVYNARTGAGSVRSWQGTKKSDGQLRPLSWKNKYFCPKFRVRVIFCTRST